MKKIFSTVLVVLLAMSLFAAAKMSYKAGTYTAAAKGMNGDVNVTVTFSKTAIKKSKSENTEKPPVFRMRRLKKCPNRFLKPKAWRLTP